MPTRVDFQPFRSIRERDIDLLILEEITVTAEFRQFLYRKLGKDPSRIEEFVNAWHSVSDSELGESDIEMGVVESDGTRSLTMIENKIDAPFQDRQLPRYQERGKQARTDGWDDFTVCVTAPQSYLDNAHQPSEPDATVSFEQIREWFKAQDTRRAAFKADMLTEAIEQNRRGYTSEPDEQVTALHRHYWTIAHKQFPELELPEPTGVPSGNLWIRFKPSILPTDVSLIHKAGKGYVDLQFSGTRESKDEFLRQYEPLIDGDMQIVPTGKSLSVRLIVSPLSASEPPEDQEAEITAGLLAAQKLLDWFKQLDS